LAQLALWCSRIGRRAHFDNAFVSFVAGQRVVGGSKLIHRRELTLPTAAMTTVDNLASLGFSQSEHLISRLLDMPTSVCSGTAEWEMA